MKLTTENKTNILTGIFVGALVAANLLKLFYGHDAGSSNSGIIQLETRKELLQNIHQYHET